ALRARAAPGLRRDRPRLCGLAAGAYAGPPERGGLRGGTRLGVRGRVALDRCHRSRPQDAHLCPGAGRSPLAHRSHCAHARGLPAGGRALDRGEHADGLDQHGPGPGCRPAAGHPAGAALPRGDERRDLLRARRRAPGLSGRVEEVLRDWWRVLAPGGTLSVGVPDTVYPLASYVNQVDDYFAWCRTQPWNPSWIETRLDQINFHFRQQGLGFGQDHLYAYDVDTLAARLT